MLLGRAGDDELVCGRGDDFANGGRGSDSASADCEAKLKTAIAPPSGIVSWWPGDGNAQDIIGSNHGTLQGGATFTDGLVGEAFTLDGTDDFVGVGDVLDMGTGSLTIDVWYKTPLSGAVMKLVNKGLTGAGTPQNAGYHLRLENGSLTFIVADESGTDYTAHAPEPSPNLYQHVAEVLDRDTNEARLYVDGSLVGNTDVSGIGSLDTNIPFAIGALDRGTFGSVSEFFQGQIDEVEIFDRALTADEIKAIYEAGSEGKVKP